MSKSDMYHHECPDCGEPEIYREGDYEWCGNCDFSQFLTGEIKK